ncbi:MAG: sugar transferase [Synergistetes bacterium]|nr:sugar transferase [Synergistota bacterium]MCX8128384.1 sugar transferase [Synergistota bacterium]MDW8192420.1 sugar transferase [Synergistota bacterium]
MRKIFPMLLLIGDAFAILLSFVLSYLLRHEVLKGFFVGGAVPWGAYLDIIPFILLIWILALAWEGLYVESFLDPLDELFYIGKATFITALLFLSFSFLYRLLEFSRVVVLLSFLISLPVIFYVRYLIRYLSLKIGLFRKQTLIVGAGETGKLILSKLRKYPLWGYEAIGFIDNEAFEDVVEGLPVLGGLEDIERIINERRVDMVIIAVPSLSRNGLNSIALRCGRLNVPVKVVPDIYGLSSASVRLEEVEGLFLIEIKRNLIKGWNALVKRAFDLLISIPALVILSPILLLISILIKIDSPGPALYVAPRLGKGGTTFPCYKFRTMYLNADDILEKYLKENPMAREEWEKFAKLRGHDPRLTRVGRFLRRWSFDELPQLWNVLRGEMSIVGPRPYLPREREKIGDYFDVILEVKPGITGLWQISGRNLTTFEERLRLDAYYIQNWSLWLDLKIIIRTLLVVLLGKGAY